MGLRLDYRGVDSSLIGEENGLNIAEEFEKYNQTIANIITNSPHFLIPVHTLNIT